MLCYYWYAAVARAHGILVISLVYARAYTSESARRFSAPATVVPANQRKAAQIILSDSDSVKRLILWKATQVM